MIKVYKENEKRLICETYEDIFNITLEPRSWIHIDEPTIESLTKLSELTNIPLDLLSCALDDEESARTDSDDGNTLIVLDTPYVVNEEEGQYTTAPFIIAYNDDFYVTIQRHKFELLNDILKRSKLIEPHKHARLTLMIVYRLATLYINYLKRLNVFTETLEKSLRNSTKNKEILQLMDANKTLIYFSTALSANKGVLSRLLRSRAYQIYEADKDLMEDTEVEINQAVEMSSIIREILSGMFEAYGAIINNNVNTIMKTLAIITISISIPSLISSIYGANVDYLPFASHKYGFWIMIAISLVLAIVGTALLILYSSRQNKKK